MQKAEYSFYSGGKVVEALAFEAGDVNSIKPYLIINAAELEVAWHAVSSISSLCALWLLKWYASTLFQGATLDQQTSVVIFDNDSWKMAAVKTSCA